MLHKRGWVIAMIWICLGTSVLQAEGLLDVASVESFALGQSVTAYRAPEAIIKNPAAATSIRRAYITSSYASYFDASYTVLGLSAGIPLGNQAGLAVVVPIQYVADIPESISDGGQAKKIGSFEDLSTMAMVAIAYRWEALSLGASLSGEYQSIHRQTAFGLTMGFGTQISIKHISVGASIQDMSLSPKKWSTGYEEISRPTCRLGMAYSGVESITVLSDVVLDPHDQSLWVNGGVKWQPMPLFSVRAGWESPMGMRLGTSLDLGSVKIAYGFSSAEWTGAVHKLSLTF